MRKDILLPALALGGGGAGFVLRRWQLASAYRPEEGLFDHGAPATVVLLGLAALLLLAFLALTWGMRSAPVDFVPAFGSPESGQMAVLAAAGLLMLAAGALELKEGLEQFRLWQMDGELYPLALPAALLLTGLLALPAGLAVLLLGRCAYRGELADGACRLSPFPALSALVWFFAIHLEHGAEPVLMRYGFGLAAAGLLMLAHYDWGGFLYGRPHPRRTVFCALSGVLLGLISLADGPGLAQSALTLALSLSALGMARALLRNGFGPPWPKRLLDGRMPARAEDEEETGPEADD